MAEAAVEERPHPKFFCHICVLEFENVSPDFKCPHCLGGFIEELEASEEDPEEELYQDLSTSVNLADLLMGGVLSAPATDDRRPPRLRYANDPSRRRRYAAIQPRHRIIRPRSSSAARAQTQGNRQPTPFEALASEFIFNLGVGWGGAPVGGNMLFLGNPGDYAWGREGLDEIVTQLLNQMDGTGPPPLPRDMIAAIPIVSVCQEQVDSKLQCSVCWEDFVLGENVRKLSCQHVYHEMCICPWLELHGTCPICRQSLSTTDSANTNDARSNGTLNPLSYLFGVETTDRRASSTSSSGSTTGPDTSMSTESIASSSSSSVCRCPRKRRRR